MSSPSTGNAMHPGQREFLAQLRRELDREHFEERAAILEYEAGFQRAEAERMAREAVLARPLSVETGRDSSERPSVKTR